MRGDARSRASRQAGGAAVKGTIRCDTSDGVKYLSYRSTTLITNPYHDAHRLGDACGVVGERRACDFY